MVSIPKKKRQKPPIFTDYIENEHAPNVLPTFKGYTVDIRCREFRKFEWDKLPEFHSFRSEKGDQLLCELIEFLPDGHKLKNQLMEAGLHDD